MIRRLTKQELPTGPGRGIEITDDHAMVAELTALREVDARIRWARAHGQPIGYFSPETLDAMIKALSYASDAICKSLIDLYTEEGRREGE
jgi:hypothetical protein